MSDFNLFIYKIFSSSDLINFICIKFSKKVIYTYCVKRIYFKISIYQQKLFFTCFYKKRMNFYNFIYKSISICFHLRKNDFYKLL